MSQPYLTQLQNDIWEMLDSYRLFRLDTWVSSQMILQHRATLDRPPVSRAAVHKAVCVLRHKVPTTIEARHGPGGGYRIKGVKFHG